MSHSAHSLFQYITELNPSLLPYWNMPYLNTFNRTKPYLNIWLELYPILKNWETNPYLNTLQNYTLS